MRAYKYVGAGNDFVLLPDFEEQLREEALPELARRLCSKEAGGFDADGLMVLRRSEQADCRMLFYNSDGSPAEMCGNGARCLCKFCHDHGLSGKVQRLETPAGPVSGERLEAELYRIALNAPTVLRHEPDYSYLELGDPGIPHAVVERDLREDRAHLRQFAGQLRHSPNFPKGANVNLYELTGENSLRLLTYERGVEDFTLACGTGTGATVLALTLLGKVSGEQTRVECEGGQLLVDIRRREAVPEIYLTGPARELYSREISLLP